MKKIKREPFASRASCKLLPVHVMAGKAGLRHFFEKDEATRHAFISPKLWAKIAASKDASGDHKAPNIVMIDGPVTLRSITEKHQLNSHDAYRVVTNQIKRYMSRSSTRAVVFIVDKPTVAEEKGVIQTQRTKSSNADSHALREAIFERDIVESLTASSVIVPRDAPFEISANDFVNPTAGVAFFDNEDKISANRKRIEFHDEKLKKKIEGIKMTQSTYTLLDTITVCDDLFQMAPDMATLLAISKYWPLPLPWADVCGKERTTIMQWITRMLLYSDEEHVEVPPGKMLILDGHYMSTQHELLDDGGYVKNPGRPDDSQYIPFLVTNSHTDGFSGMCMTDGTLESIHLDVSVDEDAVYDTIYGRYPEFENRIGEAEMTFFFYIVELCKKSPATRMVIELVSKDTDVLVYCLMFLAMCKEGVYGVALQQHPPILYHNYGTGVGSQDVCSITALYNILVTEWFRGDYSSIYSLVCAAVAAGNDYVQPYHFITCERFLEVCKNHYFDHVNMKDMITGEIREPLCRIHTNRTVSFNGKSYRRLVAAAYSQKHKNVANKCTTLLPIKILRDKIYKHIMKGVDYSADFDNLVESGQLPKKTADLFIDRHMKLLPPDEQIMYRGLQTFRMMKILCQLGLCEIKNPGKNNPTKYGFRLKDPTLPPSRGNLGFAAKKDHMMFKRRWKEATERRAAKLTRDNMSLFSQLNL